MERFYLNSEKLQSVDIYLGSMVSLYITLKLNFFQQTVLVFCYGLRVFVYETDQNSKQKIKCVKMA